ncbi:hypothetical protein EV175_005989, partial [Coemansia sp. RSA 1933]
MATHHRVPVSQASLPPPHSPSPVYGRHNNIAACAGPAEDNNDHPLFYAHNGSRSAGMYVHAGGAGNEMRKRIGSGSFPNQAEINAMDVAELRQVVSYLVCNQRSTTRSPTPASSAAADVPPALHFGSPTSPTFSSSSSYASASSLSTSAAFHRTPVRMQQQQQQSVVADTAASAAHAFSNSDSHARKRVRHDSKA